MARWVALRTLRRSISATEAAPTPQARLRRLISSTSALALPRRQGLGVADPGDLAGVGPDQHGGREDGCTQRAHADLVDAHDEALAVAPEGMLGAQVRLSGRHPAILVSAPTAGGGLTRIGGTDGAGRAPGRQV